MGMSIFDEQRALITKMIDEIATRLSEDERVGATWLEGSLGRGEGDALSDIDLVIVSTPGRAEQLAAGIMKELSMAGEVALIHEAPQNAPSEGTQLNILYDTEPLPIYVDWNVWPPVEFRPRDVTVLFEREPLVQSPSATFESVLDDFARGQGHKQTDELLNRFRVFMTPILVKDAARGRFDGANRKLGYMQITAPPITDLDGALALARQVLNDFGASETGAAVSCIRRYLALLDQHRV
jgi:predicted nucleotidyltransferase